MFEFNASGTQRLLLQPSYFVLGHFSRFLQPGATVHAAAGFTASAYADYEAVRNRTITCWRRACEPAAGLPLLSVAWSDAARGTAGLVVANANAGAVGFKLSDTRGGRASACSIPGESVQTYSFAL